MFQHHQRIDCLFKIWCVLLGSLLLITGVIFVMLGFEHSHHTEMGYLLVTGLLLWLSALNIFRKRSKGVWLFLLLFVLSLIWSYQHVALALWGVQLRLLWLAVLCAAVLLTLPAIRKYQYQVPRLKALAYAGSSIIIILLICALCLNFDQPFSRFIW